MKQMYVPTKEEIVKQALDEAIKGRHYPITIKYGELKYILKSLDLLITSEYDVCGLLISNNFKYRGKFVWLNYEKETHRAFFNVEGMHNHYGTDI